MKTLFFLPLLIISLSALGQFPDYYVDLVKGDVSLKRPGKKNTALKPRTLLYKKDVVVINKPGAELTLVNKNQEYLVLSGRGSYPIAELAARPKEKAHGITEKYFHMVWEELLHPSEDASRYKLENLVSSFGGVSRGGCDAGISPLADVAFTADTLHFKWSATEGSTQYIFTLFNAEQHPVIEVVIADTQLIISNKGMLTQNENVYFWKVSSYEDPCRDEVLRKFTWLRSGEYENQVGELITGIDKTSGNYNLEISKLLFDKGFYKLSAEYLLKAIQNQ